jgi:anti-sigma regulatory factor (Ser/Thr protein kinase)
VYHSSADQVQRVRHEVARHLSASGCPREVIDDAVLVLSELASNAIVHSNSKGQFFTVRTELRRNYVWVEVEDLGGDWEIKPHDPERPHGLDVVEALAGADGWGIDGDDFGRVAWARLDLPSGDGQ